MPALLTSSPVASIAFRSWNLLGALLLVIPITGDAQDSSRSSPKRAVAVKAATRPPTAAALAVAERATIHRLVMLEDRRARDAAETKPLIDALDHSSARVRSVAVRALGRLQRPGLMQAIAPLLRDRDPTVRSEAANAVGQAMQGARGARSSDSDVRAALDGAVELLVRAAESGQTAATTGVVARTLGRLPYTDSLIPREVERVIVQMAQRSVPGASSAAARSIMGGDASAATGVMHGLYSLARSRRVTGSLSAPALALLRSATTFGLEPVARPIPVVVSPDVVESRARVRRLAYLALAASADSSASDVNRALRDEDEQVRRLAMVAQQGIRDSAARRTIVLAGVADRSWLVRLEGVRAWRALPGEAACKSLFGALADASPHVTLAAIDALGTSCPDRNQVVDTLQRVIDGYTAGTETRTRGHVSWHAHAHALVALARVAPAQAIPVLRRDARHPIWQVRMYVAMAAQIARDTVTLSSLAFDPRGGVREAAISGLSATVKHLADRVYVSGLSSPDYHVVLAAATALRGAPLADSIVPALFRALDRLTAEQRENSRDPRIAILERIAEFGTARQATRLERYATDFDSTVARQAATTMERWTMRRVAAAPRPLTPPPDAVASVVGGDLRLFVKMSPSSGGGSFVVRLMPDEAPVTVARIVRLATAGYYTGLTFHRVEPGFVIQGGSPAATEYVGDGPFMRDEVGLVSHTRGTLGISTRGRDTGDAQLFVNLIDNFRLDHDYTVFGEILQGREIAEGILEGDVIERIDVVRVR